ncbi:porin [Azohydromonas lata]|uniref:Porin n=1 Tax=Azohydromonas lata TaxID=45677 RepID=A0ABU5IIU9_9BURK|nr:porin [Azohydromonas lata]MDZ5458028.1 porin [Azohydromonas lata]
MHHGRQMKVAAAWVALLGWGSCAWAQAPEANHVNVYGRINTGIEHVRISGSDIGSLTRLSNYRSVVGFRGEEALGDGLKALWQIEGGFSLDSGAGNMANRDTRVGLAGPWGTVFAGVWTLPYTSATSTFDPFYPTTAGYMALMGNGSAPNATHLSDTSSFDRRQANQVQYWSPNWKGLSARVAHGLREDVNRDTGAKPSLWSASVSWEAGPWLLTAAHERHGNYQTATTTDTASKLGAAWQSGPVRLAAVVERLRYGTATGELKRNAWYLSGTYRLGPGSVRVGYTRAADGKGPSAETVGFFRSGADTGASQLTLGYEYPLSKRTALQAFYSRIRNDRDAIYDFAINELGVGPGERPSVVAVGMRHSF